MSAVLKDGWSNQASNWIDFAKPAYDQNGRPLFLDNNGDLVEGIYLNMPNDVYHNLKALSSTGLKKFIESPAHYYREYLSGIDRKRTLSQRRTLDTGTHAHSLILEPEGYYSIFFRDVIPADYPKALHTATEIEACLAELNLKKTGNKAEKIERLFQADPNIEIFDKLREENLFRQGQPMEMEFEGETVLTYGGKIPVDGQVWDDAHRAMETVRNHSEANAYIQDGLPEVAILARDPITGLMLKVKFDWLRFDDAAVDVKTTQSTKPEDFSRQLFNLHYDVQQEFYKYVAAVAGIQVNTFVFVAVEFVNADVCQPYELSDKHISRAFKKVMRGLKEMKSCYETQRWYGWSQDDCTMIIQ